MSLFRSDVTRFLVKVFAIYVIWYLVYELWVLPNGFIDEPLSRNIASVSAGILSFLGEDIFYYGRVVGITGAAGVEIVDGCNGIAAIGLFLGFIFAYPGAWLPRIYFSVFGIVVIYLVNVARIVTLSLIQVYYPSAFGFTHDYSTTAIFYIIIFILWMIWVNYGDSFEKPSDSKTEPAAA